MMQGLFEGDPAVTPDLLTIPMELETGPVLYRAYILSGNGPVILAEATLGEIRSFHPGSGWTRAYDEESPTGATWWRETPTGKEWVMMRRSGQ